MMFHNNFFARAETGYECNSEVFPLCIREREKDLQKKEPFLLRIEINVKCLIIRLHARDFGLLDCMQF